VTWLDLDVLVLSSSHESLAHQ